MSQSHLIISNVSFHYDNSLDPLFKNLSLTVSSGFTALVGKNGSGKTTLLRLIMGDLQPHSGSISAPESRLYCSQTTDAIPEGLDDFFNSLYSGDNEAGRLFSILGLDYDWPLRWDTLSRGERKRAQLAAALWAAPDFLALDEPTNHLDEDAQAMLINALKGYRGIALVVSHDRAFLDSLCDTSLFLQQGGILRRPGTLSSALEQEEREELEIHRRHEQEQKELKRLQKQTQLQKEKADRHSRDFSKRGLDPKDHDAKARVDGMRLSGKDAVGARLYKTMQQRAQRAEERLENLALPGKQKTGVTFKTRVSGGRRLVHLKEGKVPLGEDRILCHPELIIQSGDRVALSGPNGSGKTSLLWKILRTHRERSQNWLYLPQEVPSEMRLELERQYRELSDPKKGELLAFFSRLNGDPEGFTDVLSMSSGELSKFLLSLGLLRESEVIILDEPTNHLDLISRMAVEKALADWPGALLLISHDQIFREKLTRIHWEIRGTMLNVEVPLDL
ncbi:ATP-binding cassette domain-containing protein [Marispirochaeta sp.]|uniref:ATP-binding cassette domain-containing protein n=1 Tax=Marispirochaeta sp. TaxID=2038653 RepID=UPI0029C644C4|nr:ATP-binding cassette domain-containing protein [Marispirochaeta sp.]